MLPRDVEWLYNIISANASTFYHEKVEQMYYITGPNGDEEGNYCHDCAHKKLAEFSGDSPNGEYEMYGTLWPEKDSFEFCDTCNKCLAAVLTDYGITNELDSLAETFNLDNPADCWFLQRIIAGTLWGSDLKADKKLSRLAKRVKKNYIPKLPIDSESI